MATSHNLISCDDILYPSLLNRYNSLLTSIYGNTVEFDTIPDQYYTIEKNNQAFYPYPTISGDGAYILITLNSVNVNGAELISSPVIVDTSTELKTNITGGSANPSTFPTDYSLQWLKSSNYVVGTTYGIGLTDAIQNAIDGSSVNSIFVRRTSLQPLNALNVPINFQNFCIHKREEDSVLISYTLEFHPSVGSVTTSDIDINFSGILSSYKIDTVETNISGFSAQSYYKENIPLKLFDFEFEEYEEKDCPCELCDNCYVLTNCKDKTIWFRSYSDLSEVLDKVIEIEEMEGCWLVETCTPKIEVTLKESYVHCKACQPKCYTPKCD